jgi:hypothetical protein
MLTCTSRKLFYLRNEVSFGYKLAVETGIQVKQALNFSICTYRLRDITYNPEQLVFRWQAVYQVRKTSVEKWLTACEVYHCRRQLL